MAQANLRAQQEQLRIGEIGGRPEEIAAAEAAMRGIDAQIKVARDNLSDATLTAPFDGIIARRDIENFSNVSAGQSIALLQRIQVVHLAFDIPSLDVTQLTRYAKGVPVDITLNFGPNTPEIPRSAIRTCLYRF